MIFLFSSSLFLLAAWFIPFPCRHLFLKKSVDIFGPVCYYNIRKRKEAKKMAKDMLEVLGDAMDEVQEWLDFEADMATNPYDDPWLD